MKRSQIRWTLCNLGLSFLFVLAGYSGLESLQSTLNDREGLGTTCVGVLNGCAVLSNLFLGPALVQRLSPKRALIVAWFAHTVYILANFYPTWATLVPASALVGLTSSLSGIAYGIYVTSLACQFTDAAGCRRRVKGVMTSRLAADEKDGVTSRQARVDSHAKRSCLVTSSQTFEDAGLTKVQAVSAEVLSESASTQNTIARFNSVMLTFTTVGGLLGNVISSIVLGGTGFFLAPQDTSDSISLLHGANWNITDRVGLFADGETLYLTENNRSTRICSIDHCPSLLDDTKDEASSKTQQPARTLVYAMLAIYLACNLLGAILACILRPVFNDRLIGGDRVEAMEDEKALNGLGHGGELSGGGGGGKGKERGQCEERGLVDKLTETLRMMTRVQLLLAVVPMFWIGVVFSFTIGAFNQSFVGCSLGIAYVGYAMTSLRLLMILVSHVSARLLHCIHRRYLIAGSMLLELVVIVSWFLVPDYGSVALLFTCCALIGCVFGIFKTVYYGLFPLLFSDRLESALAHNSMWECLGLSLAFLISDHLCFRVKAYLMLTLTLLALAAYSTLEYLIWRENRHKEGWGREGVEVEAAGDKMLEGLGEFSGDEKS